MIAATDIRLFDHRDLPWIREVTDLVVGGIGQPWRCVLERIDHADLDAHPSRVDTIVRAIRRTVPGRAQRSKLARSARALVLGHPALDREARAARLAAAGELLGMPPAEVETSLWADLAGEQPVVLPSGRPTEGSLIAIANLDRIQRAVRRARALQLRAWDRAHQLVRAVARYGLVAHVSRGGEGETVLDVTGPLALFHVTTVYGRALAQLVPLLAEQERFTLDIACDFDGIERVLHVEPPLVLPEVPLGKRMPSIAERLAIDLGRLSSHACQIERDPPPLSAGNDLVFPDLAISIPARTAPHDAHPGELSNRWLVEIVGFSTADYIAHKLERYRAAGAERVVLCVDRDRTGTPSDPSRPGEPSTEHVFGYRRRVDAIALLETLGGRDGVFGAYGAPSDAASTSTT